MYSDFMLGSFPAFYPKGSFFSKGCSEGGSACQEVLSLCPLRKLVYLLPLVLWQEYWFKQGHCLEDGWFFFIFLCQHIADFLSTIERKAFWTLQLRIIGLPLIFFFFFFSLSPLSWYKPSKEQVVRLLTQNFEKTCPPRDHGISQAFWSHTHLPNDILKLTSDRYFSLKAMYGCKKIKLRNWWTSSHLFYWVGYAVKGLFSYW